MSSVRLLIVDDMAQVRRDLRTVLPLAGAAAGLPVEIVGEAQDGVEAVQQTQALQPQAVLMDLEMPVLDGYAATLQIKALCPATQVIILSVHSQAEARSKARQSGADGFVEKGEPIQKVIQLLQSYERKEN
ncbi:MAG: response regulator transcription factor [Chloroflexota bacterium]